MKENSFFFLLSLIYDSKKINFIVKALVIHKKILLKYLFHKYKETPIFFFYTQYIQNLSLSLSRKINLRLTSFVVNIKLWEEITLYKINNWLESVASRHLGPRNVDDEAERTSSIRENRGKGDISLPRRIEVWGFRGQPIVVAGP